MSQGRSPVWCILAWLLAPEALFALSTNKAPEKPPALRPPAELLAPTWWEQQGGQVILAGLLGLAFLALLVWWLRRPSPTVPVAPEAAAKAALEALRGRAEDDALVAAVARHLRRYVQAVLRLSADEWTTDELLQVVRGNAQAGPELAQALGTILRECEARAFAPVAPPAQPALVDRALGVVAKLAAPGAPPVPAAPPVLIGDHPPATTPPAPPTAKPPGAGSKDEDRSP